MGIKGIKLNGSKKQEVKRSENEIIDNDLSQLKNNIL